MKNSFVARTVALVLSVVTIISVGLSARIVSAETYNPSIVNFVTSLYADCLGRQPDPTGLNDWCGRLTRGEITGKECAYGFFFSPEFIAKADRISDDELVDIYYRVFLNRPADTNGRRYWLYWIAYIPEDVSYLFTGFADSAEFAQKCASYGIVAGDHLDVPTTERTGPAYTSTPDLSVSYMGYDINEYYVDGYGTVYGYFEDCTVFMNDMNEYLIEIGKMPFQGIIIDPWTQTRAIELTVLFSHERPNGQENNTTEICTTAPADQAFSAFQTSEPHMRHIRSGAYPSFQNFCCASFVRVEWQDYGYGYRWNYYDNGFIANL